MIRCLPVQRGIGARAEDVDWRRLGRGFRRPAVEDSLRGLAIHGFTAHAYDASVPVPATPYGVPP
jgi:hypothetical protein